MQGFVGVFLITPYNQVTRTKSGDLYPLRRKWNMKKEKVGYSFFRKCVLKISFKTVDGSCAVLQHSELKVSRNVATSCCHSNCNQACRLTTLSSGEWHLFLTWRFEIHECLRQSTHAIPVRLFQISESQLKNSHFQ